MIPFLTIVGRLILMLLGYVASALVGSIFFHVLVFGAEGTDLLGAPPLVLGTVFVSVPVVALFMAHAAFFPAVVLAVLGEAMSARGWPFYAIGGGIVATCTLGLTWAGTPGPNHADPSYLVTLVATGMVGGIAYWAVAGRLAGSWRAISPGPSGS